MAQGKGYMTATADATKAAVYCRVSSAGQEDGSSLDTQEAACRAFAAEHGWTVEAVYREVRTGAALFDRPQMSALREAVRHREIDVVVAHALDRLTRNQAHLGLILSEADYAGVAVEFVTERLEDTPEGRLLQSVRGFVAEVERLKIAERTVRGRRARAQGGKLLPGKAALYGYRWRDDARSAYDADPVAGPVVARVFREASEGATIRGIALRFTAEGIPTPTGAKTWSPSTLHTILKRRAYTGEAVAWRYGSERTKGGGYRIVVRPEHEHVALPEGTIPPLVAPAVFDAVQHRLSRNREQAARNNRNPESSLLRSGYARCGYCGTALSVTTKKGALFYRHGTRTLDRHGCPSVQIKTACLDADVWRRVESMVTRPEVIAAEVARMREADPTGADLAAINRRLEVVVRKQGNLVKRLALIDDEDTAAVVAAEVTALSAEKRQLEEERGRVETASADWRAARDQLADLQSWCGRVAANLGALGYDQKRHLLDALGVQVRLFHTDHDPRYHVTASLPLDEVIASSGSRRCAAPPATCSRPTSTLSGSGRSSTTASRWWSTSSFPIRRRRGRAGRSAPASTR
ncbi:MAG: recombinase family protein [Chloroflexota bacterium]|nr:recombinase family protein [Chloroflexota bacterium]